MNGPRVYVIATIITWPDKIEAFKAHAGQLVRTTRREPGCIRYDLLQSLSTPTDFTFDEEWVDQSALDAHLQAAHLRTFAAGIADLAAAPPDMRRHIKVAWGLGIWITHR